MLNLQSLPELRRKSDVIGTLKNYEALLSTVAQRASAVGTQLKAVQSVYTSLSEPHLELKPIGDALSSAARSARREQQKLSQSIEGVDSRATEKAFIAIQSYVETAETKLRDKWRAKLESFIESYGLLISATEAAKLSGSGGLRSMLTGLASAVSSPPSNDIQANVVIQNIAGIRTTLANMGVETSIGKFLVETANGTADPRQIDRPEIRQFIESANLWRLLHLRLN
jgi:hypothetical protein